MVSTSTAKQPYKQANTKANVQPLILIAKDITFICNRTFNGCILNQLSVRPISLINRILLLNEPSISEDLYTTLETFLTECSGFAGELIWKGSNYHIEAFRWQYHEEFFRIALQE